MSQVKKLSAEDSALALRKLFPNQMAAYRVSALAEMFENKGLSFNISEDSEKELFPEKFKETEKSEDSENQSTTNPENN